MDDWEKKQKDKKKLKGINVENLMESVREMDIMIRDTAELIDLQNKKIASLEERIQVLEQDIKHVRINNIGTGPTA